MTLSISATAALNEVLLAAALRAERFNAAREADIRAHELAQRKDRVNRVPETIEAVEG